jgi:hypothetical protein
MSIQFSVRYLLRAGLLDQLREVADPVILLAWRDEDLERELKNLGLEVHPMIERRMGKNYDRVRSWMSLWHKRQLNTSSEGVWERRADLGRSPFRAAPSGFAGESGTSGRPTITWKKCGRKSTASGRTPP